MAAPTVEMALGGSFFGAVRAEPFYKFWQMRRLVADGYPDYIACEYPPAATIFGTFIYGPGEPDIYVAAESNSMRFGEPLSIVSVASASRDLAGTIPDGCRAITLNGTSGYLTQTYDDSLWPQNAFAATVEVVLTINALPGGGVEPYIYGSDSNFALSYKSDGKVYAYHNGSSFANATVATGTRVHLMMTRAATATDSIVFYVNGVSAGSTTPAVINFTMARPFIGKHPTNAHYLSATYEFVGVYPEALSAARALAHYNALVWTDVSADTKGIVPLVIERGIRDDSPASRVASTGTCTFAMNNLANNSGGVTGYYSPGHASCRAGFTKGAPVRVKLGSDSLFHGRIRTIAPTPGKTGGNLTTVLATDYMDAAATFLLEAVPVLEDVTGDQVFHAIVGLMHQQPNGMVTFTGTETYTLALDNTRDEAVSVLQEMHRLAVSELGYAYQLRGGRLVYEARGTRVLNEPNASVTLTNTMHGLDVAEVSSVSLNRVQITVHPREIDAAASTVLFELVNPLQIGPGEVKTIIGPYRTAASPGITTRVGGLEMVTPVVTTDYTMNVASDGTGADLSASLSILTVFGANGVRFTLTNNDAGPAYITKLQCRGKGVYDFRTVVVRAQNDAAIAADGVNALNLDMVYQEDPNVGQALADVLLGGYGDLSGTRARRVDLLPDDPGLTANLHTKDISDRIALSETVTGATGEYYINGVRLEYKAGALARLSWWLTPAEPVSYWTLGLAGASELGDTTILGAA